MQVTFLARKFALIYSQRVASLTLDCNGVFAIKAYARCYEVTNLARFLLVFTKIEKHYVFLEWRVESARNKRLIMDIHNKNCLIFMCARGCVKY